MKPKSIFALCIASANQPSALVLALALASLLASQAHAANKTWDGGGGVDTNWLTAANWDLDTAPAAADNLIFVGSTSLANANNFTADTSFGNISFTNTNAGGAAAVTGNFAITGNRITLGGNITTTAIGAAPSPTTITDSLGLAMILSGNRTITTNTSHNLTITGIISEDASSRSLSKLGAATLTLQGANTFTGSLQSSEGILTLSGANGSAILSSGLIINGVTINLTNTAAANNIDRLKDSGTVSMNGGTFNFSNNAGAFNYSETTGALSFNQGANTVSSSQAAAAQTSALTFASVSRSLGATTNFSGTGLGVDARNRILITANPALSNNIIGSWATFTNTDWASYDATNGVIVLPPASYTADTWAAGNNTTVTTSSAPVSASETNSLRFNLASADTVTLDGVNTISSGGILVATAVGANVSTITGGTLQGSVGGELVIHQINATVGGGLVIGSILQDNTSATSLVKSGNGIVTLTATNTYTGGTVINAGNVVLINAGAGETLQGPITLRGNSRVVLGKSNQISDSSVITFGSGNNGSRFNLTNVAGVGYSETIGGINDAAGVFTGSRIVESASDTLSGSPGNLTINTATGQTYTFGGLVRNAAGTLAVPGSSNLSITKDGPGIQVFSGAAANISYSGGTTVNAGTLRLTGASSFLGTTAVTLNGGFLEFGGTGTYTRATALGGGAGGVIKSGTGIMSLTGDNTYTGTTTVTNGTLKLDRSGGTIADTATVAVTADTAILDVTQSDTIATLNLANAATVSGAGTLTVSTLIAPNIAISKINTISASLGGTAQLKKTGQGTTILSAVNSYSGGTWINGANSKLTISGSGTLGNTTGTLLIDTAGTVLDLGTTSQTVGAVTLTAGTIQNGTLTGTSYGVAAGTVSAALGGSGVVLAKTTTGIVTLSGTNTYTGATSVSDGTLLINGNNSAATGAVTISTPGTVGGNGTLGGSLTVSSGATLAPGAASATVGTLTTAAGASIPGTYACDVDGATADKLAVTGTITLSGPLTVNLLGGGFTQPSYIIAEGTTLSGTFSSVPAGYAVTYNSTQAILSSTGDAYTTWINSFTPNPLLPDAASKLPSADPDNDGISNLLEFVLAGSPVVSSQSISPTLATVGSSQVLSYKRSDESESPATTQIGQWSTDLAVWNAVTPVLVNENGSLPDDMTITVPNANAVGGKLFLRLNVVK